MGISRHIPPPAPLTTFVVPAAPELVQRDVGVIIVAAGQSTRLGGGELKQFRWVAGKPMLLHSVRTFLARPYVCAVVCVLPERYVADPPPWLLQNDLERMLLSVGGKERGDSVRNGLDDLAAEARVVLVHDAARPFVPQPMIDRVVRAAREGRAAVPAIAVADTIKEVDGDRVVRTIDRARLWRAQTPQGFPRELIARAYRAGTFSAATDDASLVERLGEPVTIVQGSARAMKITVESDFALADALAALDDAGG